MPRAVKSGARNPQNQAHHEPPPPILRLAELRRRYAPKLRQREVAKLLGVARQRVSEWERGVATPSVAQLVHLIVGIHELPLELAFDGRWWCAERERMRARLVECGFPRRHEADTTTETEPYA